MSQGAVENNVDRVVTTATLTQAWSKLWDLINQILRGKINAVIDATVTLRASQTTTTLTHELIGPKSIVLFMPTTANAAFAAPGIYITGRLQRTCTINHASNVAVDQTFVVAIIG